MKMTMLSLIVALVTLCCKKSTEQVLEEIPEAGNYLLIDNQKYEIDTLLVIYQNTTEGKSFQIMAINEDHEVLMGVQYLVLKTDKELPVGEFNYLRTADLKKMTAEHFYNIVVKCKAPDGADIVLDGLAGTSIDTGSLKIGKDQDAYHLLLSSLIGGRKVMMKYSGAIISEEFEW